MSNPRNVIPQIECTSCYQSIKKIEDQYKCHDCNVEYSECYICKKITKMSLGDYYDCDVCGVTRKLWKMYTCEIPHCHNKVCHYCQLIINNYVKCRCCYEDIHRIYVAIFVQGDIVKTHFVKSPICDSKNLIKLILGYVVDNFEEFKCIYSKCNYFEKLNEQNLKIHGRIGF